MRGDRRTRADTTGTPDDHHVQPPRRHLPAGPGAIEHHVHHPHLTFASTALVQHGSGWLVRGTLTARGVAAPVDLSLTAIAQDRDEVTVHATATIDRYAHGLTKGRGLAARHLQLQLTVTVTRA